MVSSSLLSSPYFSFREAFYQVRSFRAIYVGSSIVSNGKEELKSSSLRVYSPGDDRLDTLRDSGLVEGLHVGVHLLEVLGQRAVCVAPRYGAEFEHGFVREGPGESVIVHAAELVELLPCDHEGGQIGSVNGEEHHGEQRPDVRHKSTRSDRIFVSRGDHREFNDDRIETKSNLGRSREKRCAQFLAGITGKALYLFGKIFGGEGDVYSV